MPMTNEENKERMAKLRAAQKEKEQEDERNAIAAAIVEKLADTLPGIILNMMQGDAQLNQTRTKMSCVEESMNPAPYTPPRAAYTGGTRGRSPAVESGNGRKKVTKQEAKTPPTSR